MDKGTISLYLYNTVYNMEYALKKFVRELPSEFIDESYIIMSLGRCVGYADALDAPTIRSLAVTLYTNIMELIKHRDASNLLLDGGKRETLETYDKLLKLSEEWLAINRG